MARPKAKIKQRPVTCLEREAVWLDTDRAALILGVSPPTLRKLARNGQVKASKLGPRLWRYSKDDLQELVSGGETQCG